MITDKIGAPHRERKAVLYVRQSSAHQVLHNRESQALQYAMRERLTELGWSEIEIIDEDLGLSAAGGTTRAGFACSSSKTLNFGVNGAGGLDAGAFAANHAYFVFVMAKSDGTSAD